MTRRGYRGIPINTSKNTHETVLDLLLLGKGGSVDSLVCIDGIEHLRRPFDFIAEVRRVLRIGGEVILSTPNISSLRSRLRWLLTGHHHKCPAPLDERNPNPLHHINMISFPELRYLLHSNGFRIDMVTANRCKPIAFVSSPLALPAYLATWWTYRRESRRTDSGHLADEVRRAMFSRDILFGETCIIRARKLVDPIA